MFGGLKKSASRLALVAAAGVLSTGAYAADLGGDCCADLEERVAELEATTARKGNRKVSLTISGQVNRAIMYYNDGVKSNTFFGLDNTNSSTRFGFSGAAKITPTLSAGFTIVIDIADTGRTAAANQANEDGGSARGVNCTANAPTTAAGVLGPAGTIPAVNCRNNTNGDHFLRMRNAFWYLESATVGRIQVGRMATSGSTGVLDLAGVSVIAAGQEGCIGTALGFRNSNSATGALAGSTRTVGSYTMSCAHPTYRAEAIQYISPTFAGFTFSASVGEAAKTDVSPDNVALNRQEALGINYGVDLKYAGEFSGVRIAASLGYEKTRLNDDDGSVYNSDFSMYGASLALLHVPTGLFAQGYYGSAKGTPFDTNPLTTTVPGLLASTTSGQFGESTTATVWHIQAGIKQNWFGFGATALYGEYAKFNKWAQLNTQSFGPAFVGGAVVQGVTASAVNGDKLTLWGVGIVQNIDAAAMELYLGYRNYKATDDSLTVATKPIDVIAAGARIKF